MTTLAMPLIGAPASNAYIWDKVDWPAVKAMVTRLQMRIAKAVREGKRGKVKALQRLLTHSYAAKILAVRRVTTNRGSKTPGVDGVIWNTAQQKIDEALSLSSHGYKSKPLRRIYIPKKNGKERPLGIPTMKDRTMQALHLLSLEPIAESIMDPNYYGFRPHRSAADAIEQCFNNLARRGSPQWVLEGDIKACFDNINHDWLLQNISMDKEILGKWLKAGFVENKKLFQTDGGTPQGGIISPTLANLTLSGLEAILQKNTTSRKHKVYLIAYADDFIITAESREILQNKVMPLVKEFLKQRGLELSEEKTAITHIDDGFDFLGFNIRKYNGKLIIKPSKKSIKAHLQNIRDITKSNMALKTENLINVLNPKIKGWANYYRHCSAKKSFNYIDHFIFLALSKWTKRRHPKKNAHWLKKKYFRSRGNNHWTFHVKTHDKDGKEYVLDLQKASDVSIKRHVKIRAHANPYDPAYQEYFEKRKLKKLPLSLAQAG